MDPVAMTALVVSVLGALGHFVTETHIQRCSGCCFESDCRKNKTPPHTPKENITEL